MAFIKTADAIVEQPNVNPSQWDDHRSDLINTSGASSFRKTASSSLDLSEYPPDEYLLTHCTIIASVDVDKVPDVKTGEKVSHNGQTIKRPYDDYYITPDTAKYVNDNGDAWERDLLLSCFDSFIGAENYVEHIQVPEMSKGKVVDAVSRDLGDTVYVDILVATNRKHGQLISDIESGKVNTLSMGCSIQYSICSKCGNVAADETDLCRHVKYEKGNHFHDHSGNQRVIAELCGHKSDPDSVEFIEASWVAEPAFKGAVLQSILNSDTDISEKEREQNQEKYQEMMSQSPMLSEFMASQNIDQALRSASVSPEEVKESIESIENESVRQMVASSFGLEKVKESFNGGGMGDEEEDEGEDKSRIEKIKEEIKEEVHEESIKELKKELKEELGVSQPEPVLERTPEQESLNDTIINSYKKFSQKYSSEFEEEKMKSVFRVVMTARKNGWGRVSNIDSVTNRDIVASLYIRDRDVAKETLPKDFYECLIKVGGVFNYNDKKTFLNACTLALGREITKKEAKILLNRGKILK